MAIEKNAVERAIRPRLAGRSRLGDGSSPGLKASAWRTATSALIGSVVVFRGVGCLGRLEASDPQSL